MLVQNDIHIEVHMVLFAYYTKQRSITFNSAVVIYHVLFANETAINVFVIQWGTREKRVVKIYVK